MAKKAILVRFVGDPEKHETRLDVVLILYAVCWPAIEAGLVRAGWVRDLPADAALRRYVLVVTPDRRVGVTRYTSIAGFLEDVGDPDFVHAHQSVCVNVRRIDRVVRAESMLVYYPRGLDRREDRETVALSRTGRTAVLQALEDTSRRRPAARCARALRAHARGRRTRPTATTRLLLVRHAETDADVAGRWQAAPEGGLTPRGRAQAGCVAAALAAGCTDLAAIYTSPAARARETADAVAAATGAGVVVVPALAERAPGALEGAPWADVLERHGMAANDEVDPGSAPPGGESLAATTRRVVASWQTAARRHRGREVVIVSHEAALAVGLATLVDGDPRRWPRWRPRGASVTELMAGSAQAALVRFDDVGHLG